MQDWQLIQDYVERGSESAFRELVARHLDMVHSAALRQVQNAQLAEEITQAVFILLARKARDFRASIVLPGWLFRTTRFIAQRALRTEQRRQRREQEAYAMQPLTTPENAAPVLAPLLDEALAQLQAKDRDAVLLRFMHDQSLRQVGDQLGLSEEAAKKRVSRAVDKLRGFFAGRGFTISIGVLSSVLEMHSVQAAPASLAAQVAAGAVAQGTVASTALPSLVQETLNAWRRAKLIWAGSVASVGVAIVITGLLVVRPDPQSDSSGPDPFLQAVAPDPVAAVPIEPPPIGQQRLRPGEKALDLLVISRDTSDPVAHATVAMQTVHPDGRWEQRQDLATDASGRIEVPYPAAAGRLDVGVFSPGFAARYATWMAGKDDPIPTGYILRLDRVTHSVGGWLRDASDRPVAGAEVVAAFGDRGDSSGRETPRERRGLPVDTVVARSGPDGGWTTAIFPQEAHGGFTLSAMHPDFATTVIAADGFGSDLSNPLPLRSLSVGEGFLERLANDFHPVILASKLAPVISPNLPQGKILVHPDWKSATARGGTSKMRPRNVRSPAGRLRYRDPFSAAFPHVVLGQQCADRDIYDQTSSFRDGARDLSSDRMCGFQRRRCRGLGSCCRTARAEQPPDAPGDQRDHVPSASPS